MGGGGWFYVPKVRIPEAFLAAMLCAMLSFGVGYGWRLHGWARGRTQARGAKPKAMRETVLVGPVVGVGWSVLVHPFRWAPRPLFAAKQFLGGGCAIWRLLTWLERSPADESV